MDLTTLTGLLTAAVTSRTAMAIAAALLALLVWGLQKVPAIGAWVAKNPTLTHVATLVLAVVPAVIVSLTTTASWVDALTTALVTFLAAVGVQGVATAVSGSAAAAK